jgi:hypothetical protein
MRNILFILLTLALLLSAGAAPPPQPIYVKATADTVRKPLLDSAEIASVKPMPEPDSMSTQMSGVDSLGVLPTEVETPYQGGVRHVTLEKSVFHREHAVVYDAGGKRDPFRALIVDEKKEGEIETDLLRLDGAILTGVVWSDGQYLAMVKDKDQRTFFLREGDPVYKGKVVIVTQSQATFGVSDFGDYDEVTLKLKVKA